VAYQLYIELEESNPTVWRRVAVPETYTLNKLHLVLQAAFGWENNHLFEFRPSAGKGAVYGVIDPRDPDPEVKDARRVKLKQVLQGEGEELLYVYDFGDNWRHRIMLEKIAADETKRPYCIDGAGACPPEDVGGIPGYEGMLEALKDPGSSERDSYREWLGLGEKEEWDPEYCSVREVNRRLWAIR
jgi:hypothetical protein